MNVLKCNSALDAATLEAIDKAVVEINAGNLVVYPTDTVYGIGANPFDQIAVKKLFLAKNRPFDMPLTVAVADKDMIEQVIIMTKPVEKLIDAFLPGPLTIITNKNFITFGFIFLFFFEYDNIFHSYFKYFFFFFIVNYN